MISKEELQAKAVADLRKKYNEKNIEEIASYCYDRLNKE